MPLQDMSAVATLPGPPPVKRADRAFYAGMAVASILAVFAGFARSYFLRGYFGSPPLRPLLHVHGFVFTSWILLFFVQTVLIASRHTGLHRRLGAFGAAWAALVVVIGLTTAVSSARRNVATGGDGTLAFLAIPFGDMLVFAILAAAAIAYRRRPETHKRLMLVATVSILDAAIARWPLSVVQSEPFAFFFATDLFVVAGICYDLWSRRRVHPAYLWAGLLLVVSQPLRLSVGHTDAWLTFTRLLVR